jgi:similar to stage IV sporulation protein
MKSMNQRKLLISVKKSEQASQFIRSLKQHHITLSNIEFHEHHIRFYIRYTDLKLLRHVRRKFRVKLSIRYASPNRIIQRDVQTILGLLLLVVLPIFLGQYVWKMDVQAETIELSDEVMHYLLHDLGIELPTRQKDFISDHALRQQIMQQFRQFSWIHITKKGGHILISPQLAPVTKQLTNGSSRQHLIASNSGVITHFNISKGIRMVDPNTTVYKGDTLVSGILTIGDTHHIVGAEGDVFADYWLETTFSIPKSIQIQVLTDYGWKYDFDVPLLKKAFETTDFSQLRSVIQLKPYRQVETKTLSIDEEHMDTVILPLLHEKMLRSLPLKSTIKSENILHVYTDDDTVKGKVLFLVNENIAKPLPIHQGE